MLYAHFYDSFSLTFQIRFVNTVNERGCLEIMEYKANIILQTVHYLRLCS